MAFQFHAAVNDLGITLTKNLSWGKHHEHILAKAYAKLSMVRHTFGPYTSILTRKNLYTSLIQSQFLYGSLCSSKI